MARFIYRVKRAPTEILEGNIEADSERVVINRLFASGLYPLSIEQDLPNHPKNRSRVKTKDLLNFTSQLAALLGSGLTLFNALNMIESQMPEGQFKKIINSIIARIKSGMAFSDSLMAYQDIFSELYINIIKSGEAGGNMDEALQDIQNFLEKQENVRHRVISALIYPALTGAVGIITIFILMAFVVPKLQAMFFEMGQELPLLTRLIINVSAFIKKHWVFIILFSVSFGIFIKRYSSSKVAKRAFDSFKLNIPFIGEFITKIEIARFSRTLSMLLRRQIPILYSLKITSSVMTNEIIKEGIEVIYKDVRTGSLLSRALKKNGLFPQFVVNMAGVGEEGGELDRVLLKVANSYEIEIERIFKIISSLIEPVIILAMGILVGIIVISVLLPVFQLPLVAY